jgi:energy-coupling factor transporter ATP-binding protein EcfA2
MEHEQGIQELGRFARRLAEDMRTLKGSVPFGEEVFAGQHSVERLERPGVAVVGVKGVGKSTLVQALDGAGVPAAAPSAEPGVADALGAFRAWEWREAELAEGAVAGLAEVWVLVTSALEPLSLRELQLLRGLGERAPEPGLRVVFTRADEVPAEELPALEGRMRQLLAEVLPGRTVPCSVVSGRTGAGVAALRKELLQALFQVHRDRVMEEVEAWGAAVLDLRALLEMRELAAVKPQTIDQVQARLDALLSEEGVRLRGQLDGALEEFLRGAEEALPRPRRQLTDSLREALVSRVRAGMEGLHPRLNQELAHALRGDAGTETTLALTNRFEVALEAKPRFFDWQSARTVGAVGAMGAALVARMTGKPSGWAVTGGTLLGGLLGGLFGKASTVDSRQALHEQVVDPVLRETEQRLRKALESSREDVTRLCKLLRQVIQVFSDPKAGTYDVEALKQVVALAEASQKQLDGELGRFSQKFEAEVLLEKLNLSWPGTPSQPETKPVLGGQLSEGSGPRG